MRFKTFFSSVLTIALFSACATIMNGTKQSVGISSVPSGARVTIDGTAMGTAPVMAQLSRKKLHLIKIELDGYAPFELYTKRKYSGWLWGNVLLGGLIGLGIDVGTGGLYKIAPGRVSANLIQRTVQNHDKDSLYIEAFLSPNSNWEKIGDMKKIF